MRLTQFSNLAIRILTYAGVNAPRLCTIPEMARAYGASYDHLKKAAGELCRLGYLEAVRGRAGGFRLARLPDDIRIGEVIRQTEGDTILAECSNAPTNTCPLIVPCRLRVALEQALAAFFGVLDRYTLADLIREPGALAQALGLGGGSAPAPPPQRRADGPRPPAPV